MSTITKSHDLDTTNWNSFPFTANGVNFISKISPESPFLSRIAMLPAGVFEKMNYEAVRDLLADYNTVEELVQKLYHVNKNATHAVIELA